MDIIKTLLANRGLKTKKAIEEFWHPTQPEDLKSPFDSKPAIRLIKSHIKKGHKIAIYGDYDVDGICSTAILWETIYSQYKNVFPHIPHRESEGYGLSIAGIDHCLEQGAKLIIAVDNGIVAHEQVAYCRKKKCDIIIIDHHEVGSPLNTKYLIHNTSSCAAGLTWFFCRDYLLTPKAYYSELLSLVAIATICDIIPLLGPNRSFAKYGLEELNHTTRPGLLALFTEAGIKSVGPYEVGFVIGPRLNAAGRLEHAIDSLRLLCTKDPTRARQLAASLGQTNRARQDATFSAVSHALSAVKESNLIVVSDSNYHPGIIGLVAAKLVEKYYRPAIAISVGEQESKGSARSIPGFHITDHLRTAEKLLVSVGGHAMAAGFTVENSKLEILISKLTSIKINPELLVKKQRIDAEISLTAIDQELMARLKEFEPYGLGNPTPIFSTPEVKVSDIRRIGKDNKHLKFTAGNLEAVWFNAPLDAERYTLDAVDLIYQIEVDSWNGQSKLQLLIKDVQKSS
ncbi:MAG: single-stranded-DNA-specific exonuclease RecJ [Candidatus Amesbacteria bacterium GW2011_GWA2_47_11b]|uniref:Single-stranded-DNA-specific exonuclease RecJ n=3 Tax=Candidatus Amesiibacteriota TaxID=1752730 RepID=A0A0G1USA3_9BACT|nr:MAG: single-stranded-DNA-specific exonuclease RecJ [Candidatus Amesbacteria bacterium GW2011_GWA2_47_11b]KKU68913.1 MAG: single-stranded-DNA-specific exonuclease RecJ [Candidatus Amesbacteria bacterium GW2011_GWA1_47_20]KKU83582.1 MAG: single-stranded-DNA-specific exonuclease RecJ [Candidatus Amesbacteria bacterium GW2011_GWC2_47_8]